MSTHTINPVAILDADECRALDTFGAAHRGAEALPALAMFLRERFGCELTLDHDIVSGFAKDSSNLPGVAEALARPQDERQVAVFLRACRAAGVRMTLSGGKSNLTGSATPEGGVVLSIRDQIGVPVKFVGTGETADDFAQFDAETFVAALFGDETGRDV
jgi:FAD/FMN-containing dehydrogenase